jgi:TM2 domain-containing membrane protein YozV
MNCATHSDQAAVAFCRTCGKPLCNQCTRDVRGVIYCEACLAARMEGAASAAPASGFVPPAQTVYPPSASYQPGPRPTPSSGPNPAVAGILAGFFPFGVGAVYCSQYAKGLAHLVIMVLLIIGVSSDVPWYVHTVLGLAIGFFYVYQIIDAVRSAKAIQMGEPAPDPFGLGAAFGASEKMDGTKVPAGAAVLIGLGVLFLLHTAGLFEVGMGVLISLTLIVLGVWLFAKHWGLLGTSRSLCMCEHCRTRRLMVPAILVTLGVLFLLDNVSRFEFHRTWPAILLVIGVVKLVQSNASYNGHVGPLPGPSGGPPNIPPASAVPGAPETPAQGVQPPSSGEVKNV